MPRLCHPNIIRMLGHGEVDGRLFLVLEALSGVLYDALPKPWPDESSVCEHYWQAARWPPRHTWGLGAAYPR